MAITFSVWDFLVASIVAQLPLLEMVGLEGVWVVQHVLWSLI